VTARSEARRESSFERTPTLDQAAQRAILFTSSAARPHFECDAARASLPVSTMTPIRRLASLVAFVVAVDLILAAGRDSSP
jgi:hypothetical protein